MSDDTEQCWIDTAGDLLEAEGIDPGCIFEFSDQIHPDLTAGGCVATNLPPGQVPTSLFHIARVVLREERTGELHPNSGFWPMWVFNAHMVRRFF